MSVFRYSAIVMLFVAPLFATTAAAAELVPSVLEHVFEYAWTPATAATHYEVEEEVYGFSTLVNENSLRQTLRSVVADRRALVTPEIGEQRRIRVRGMAGDSTPSGDCAFERCGPWSEWADVRVGRINNPDLDGDDVVGTPDFIPFSNYWGQCIYDWRIQPCVP